MTKDLDQLVAELADDAGTVKPAPHPYLLGLQWIVAATAYLVVALALSDLRPDLAQALKQPWFIAEIAALLAILVAASMAAALLSFPDLYQKRQMASAPAWILALFLLIMLCAQRADSPPASFPLHRIECTISIISVALPPAAWTFYAMRKFASTHYRWAGSIALVSAFSVGAIWLRLHEVNDSIWHVIEWHYLPMLAAGVIGLWVGKVLLKW